ncbi:hypothetical protein PHLCEN_2v11879 [Hermanssonia centrifuga]|uniref:Cytochrome P450 monooxygenase n=1 Tax=Hermanssonia centrifuga TaxID=98765 RepID=A0A2R6NIT1_9APHY|nr:hypothetical protein PHLCEN_2v11879 [Hermanssonia centrifuga]
MSAIQNLFDRLVHLDVVTILAIGASALLLAHILPYLVDPSGIRSYPGPLAAKLSHVWLGWIAARGRINTVVHEEHQKHGPFVRIAPNHVSIAHPSALQTVYGHGGGALKSDFYSKMVQFRGTLTVFTTRTREDHTRKRKMLAHTLSQKSVLEFEPIILKYQRILVDHWDRMCADAAKGLGGSVGQCNWCARDGRAFFDCLPWFNYQAFDIIGDLSFGSSFGMTAEAKDTTEIAKSQDDALDSFGIEKAQLEYETIAAVKTVNDRSTYAISIAVLPNWWVPMVRRLPWYSSGKNAMEAIATMAVTAVAKRLRTPSIRNDLLTKLLEGQDEKGNKMGSLELSAEAMTFLIAGSDTTSNSAGAITYYLAHNQNAQAKLQRELDEALGAPTKNEDDEDSRAIRYDQLKNLTYLQDAINEGLRLHSTVGVGLPRVVPEGGLTILGKTFAPGTIVSVPTYTVHRDKAVWGEDADVFNPDRWTRGDKAAMQKAFAPFSVGSRY